MNGSEKQIKWATEKVQSAINANARRLQDEQACYAADIAEGYQPCQERLAVRQAVYEIVDAYLRDLLVTGNASDIINYGVDRSKALAGHMASVPHHDWIKAHFPTGQAFRNWI